MSDRSGFERLVLEWSTAARPYPGLEISGDLDLVLAYESGVLMAAVDGLGHGPDAAIAAQAAVAEMRADPARPLPRLFEDVHASLKHTRGVVMTAARLQQDQALLEWGGVGNVEAVLVRPSPNGASHEYPPSRPGIVGYQMSRPVVASIPVQPGDILIFATDGIHASFVEHVLPNEPPSVLSQRLLRESGKATDDALVLVVRFNSDHHVSRASDPS